MFVTKETGILRRSVILSVCYSQISGTVHQIYFTLGRLVAEDVRKCRVEFDAIWTFGTLNINTFGNRNGL